MIGADGKPVPEWLMLLRILRYEAGQPTLRDLSKRTLIPRATIGNTFKGTSTPTSEKLGAIVTALTDDPEKAAPIIGAFGQLQRQKRQREASAPFEPLEFRTDAQILADAINNLAEAIRGLHPDR